MAAHAASILDNDVVIMSNRLKPSRLNGCQYLHSPIPGITNTYPIEVSYELRGTPEEYGRKVYGEQARGLTVSPVTLEEDHLAWDLRQTYDSLWKVYGKYVQEGEIRSWVDLRNVIANLRPDAVLSTIPAHVICGSPSMKSAHHFDGEEIWAMGDAPGIDVTVPIPVPDATIWCDASKDISWYRAANVFGHKTVEWPFRDGKKPPLEGVVQVTKPLQNNCECHKDFSVPVYRLGRYGKWEKGVLSHTAFYDAFGHLGGQVRSVSGYFADTLPGL